MKRAIVITDVTRMKTPRVCVAGYFLDGDQQVCARMELSGSRGVVESDLRFGDQVIAPFSLVEADLQKTHSRSPHVEDYHWFGTSLVETRIATDRIRELLRATDAGGVQKLFGDHLELSVGDRSWSSAADVPGPSLGTVWAYVHELTCVDNRGYPDRQELDLRLRFSDADRQEFTAKITDLAAQRYVERLWLGGTVGARRVGEQLTKEIRKSGATYLRLGLARPFPARGNRCYLQVNGIYTFPDYLGGRNWSDFA